MVVRGFYRPEDEKVEKTYLLLEHKAFCNMLYTLKKVQNKNPGEKPGFYFIAKKKVFKKAVDRNRAKRIARHAFKKALIEVNKGKSRPFYPITSLLFFLERDMIHTSFEEIVSSFNKDLLNFK
ncbi:MAG: Ribonuclease [Candidatus Parcubacteria bacterium]|jgi:ribonuclease P protein component